MGLTPREVVMLQIALKAVLFGGAVEIGFMEFAIRLIPSHGIRLGLALTCALAGSTMISAVLSYLGISSDQARAIVKLEFQPSKGESEVRAEMEPRRDTRLNAANPENIDSGLHTAFGGTSSQARLIPSPSQGMAGKYCIARGTSPHTEYLDVGHRNATGRWLTYARSYINEAEARKFLAAVSQG